MEWPNQTLLTADDTEFIRSAIDVALSTAGHEAHTGDIYDLNATTWAIWLVQHVYVVRKGSWTAESEQAQHSLTFENLYDWLETQHARGDNFNVTEQATKRLLHRYKLPFKKMTVPPKQNELFKWKKGAKRLRNHRICHFEYVSRGPGRPERNFTGFYTSVPSSQHSESTVRAHLI